VSPQTAAAGQEALPRSTPEVFRRRRKLPFFLSFYSSAVGKKWVMALSGIALMGYVLVHMIGNLHLYEGPEQVNSYAEALRDLGGDLTPRSLVLWLLRIGLAGAFLIHIHAAYSLTRINMKARPHRYESKRDYVAANYASRTMRWSGVIVLAYVGFHLSDLTWGWISPDYIRGDVYNNVVESMSVWWISLIYMVSMIVLAIHLFHGAWSMFQSLGLNNPRYNSWRRGFAFGFAAVILAGNLSFPLAVSWGLISQDNRCWPSEQQIQELEEAGVPPDQITPETVDAAAEQGICIFQLGDDAIPVLTGQIQVPTEGPDTSNGTGGTPPATTPQPEGGGS
jgi:succinate dehydrogenase / fumarate reductase cytochrome b subunit